MWPPDTLRNSPMILTVYVLVWFCVYFSNLIHFVLSYCLFLCVFFAYFLLVLGCLVVSISTTDRPKRLIYKMASCVLNGKLNSAHRPTRGSYLNSNQLNLPTYQVRRRLAELNLPLVQFYMSTLAQYWPVAVHLRPTADQLPTHCHHYHPALVAVWLSACQHSLTTHCRCPALSVTTSAWNSAFW